MKRSKAFILVEILTGMALQAGFIIVLCTSFYLMLSFYTRTQQTLTARQKGEKVIAYVDARIRNTGLGLHECSSSSEIKDGFYSTLRNNLCGNQNLKLPVAVTSGNWNYKAPSNGKFTGNRLTLLYTQRPPELNFSVRTPESPDRSGYNIPVVISQDAKQVCFVTGSLGETAYNNSDFSPSTASSRRNYLNSYTVTAGAGRPVYITAAPDNSGNIRLKLQNSSPSVEATIYPGDELLYLKCERMFVEGENFKFWRFELEDDDVDQWSKTTAYSNEQGILDIYFELDTNNNILDMYVLASGGYNDSRDTKKPAIWNGTWTSDYANYIVYVSRASWKLSNISSSFRWD